jgi:hypothetical protein
METYPPFSHLESVDLTLRNLCSVMKGQPILPIVSVNESFVHRWIGRNQSNRATFIVRASSAEKAISLG